jgi:predicted nucleic acid-binding protein
MRYLDTSVLVSVLTANEVASERARAWLDRQDGGDLVISEWVVAEFSAALSIKLRTGALVETQRARALAIFGAMVERSLRVLPIEGAQFRVAARLCDQFALGLKAGDALHLAVAFDRGATLCSLDRRQIEAAGSLGVMAELI